MLIKLLICSVVAVLIAIAVNHYIFSEKEAKCSLRYEYPVKHMATKSPYIHPEDEACSALGICHLRYSDSVLSVPQGCSAEQIWMLVRHGSRNPSAKVIKRIKNILVPLREEILRNYQNSNGDRCEDEIEGFRNWKVFPGLEESVEKYLVPQGEVELEGIAKRFQRRYPKLFVKTYNKDTFYFKFTKTQRAEASAKSFAIGIFGKEGANNVWYPEALHADPILRFYKGCPKWKHDVDKNPDAYKERVAFEESPDFRDTIKNMQNRNGLTRDLSLQEIETVYLACAFETSWKPSSISPWCAFFDENDLKMLEYRQDLEYYWIDGHGFELTYKQACPAVKDFMDHFSAKMKQPTTTPSVIAYFTHSGTTLKLLARLGLFKDSEELRSDNFRKHLENRKWRTSIMDKFATNLAFVLYKCPDDYKVGTLFQEQPIGLPACDGNWMCSYDTLNVALDSVVNNCDIKEMCKI